MGQRGRESRTFNRSRDRDVQSWTLKTIKNKLYLYVWEYDEQKSEEERNRLRESNPEMTPEQVTQKGSVFTWSSKGRVDVPEDRELSYKTLNYLQRLNDSQKSVLKFIASEFYGKDTPLIHCDYELSPEEEETVIDNFSTSRSRKKQSLSSGGHKGGKGNKSKEAS